MQLADFSPSSNRDICNAQASEALAAAGLPAAVRKALDFEHELAKLTHGQGPRATAAQLMSHVCMCARVQAANSGCHGVSKTCSELQRAQRLASVGVFKNQDGDGFGWGVMPNSDCTALLSKSGLSCYQGGPDASYASFRP